MSRSPPPDDLVHRLTITAEIPTGPGVEIVVAELLLTWSSASAIK